MEETRNLAVRICFSGAQFHGFQRQQNALSVQQVIEETLFKITGEHTVIFGCSRTDTGVSAEDYVFNFHTKSNIEPKRLKGALNHLLPDSIGVADCADAQPDFHARYCTKKKQYRYTLRNASGKDPFCEGRIYRYTVSKIDAQLLEREAQAFEGTHDFSAFCSEHDGAKSHVRTIYAAEVTRQGDDVIFTFCADGFLYNMVRIMVGTLLFISEGKIRSGTLSDIIESRERKRAGMTAPAGGLCLTKVFYDDDPFI